MSKPVHASQSAPVHEYRVLWTAQKKQKLKRWHDGFLRLHTFNNRMVLYDDGRNLVGDKYNKAGETLHEGDELEFEQHLVTIEEFMKTVQQDLTPVFSPAIQRRQQRNAASVQNTPLRVPMGAGDLNTPLRTPTGAMNTPYGVGQGMTPGPVGRPLQYGQPAAQTPMRYPAPGVPQNNAVSRQPPPRAQPVRPQTGAPRQGYGTATLPSDRGSVLPPQAPLQHQNAPGMRHAPAQRPAQPPQAAQITNGPPMGHMSRSAPSIAASPTRPPQPPPLTQETPTPAYRPAPKPRSPPPPPLFQPALRAQPPLAPRPPLPQSETSVRQPRPPPPPQQFHPAPQPRHPPAPQVRPQLVPPQPSVQPVQPETPARAPSRPVPLPIQKPPTPPAPKPAPPPHHQRRILPQPAPHPVPERQLVAEPEPEPEFTPTEAPRPEFRRPKFRPPQRRPPAETTPESAAPTTLAKPDGQPTLRSPPLFNSPPLIPRELILKSVDTPESPRPDTTILKLPMATRRTRSKLLCLKRPSATAATTEVPPKRLKPSTFAEDIEDDETPPSSPKPSGDPWNSQAVDEDWAVDDANMFVGNGDDDGYDNEGTWSREAFCLFDFKRPKVKK